MGTGLKDNIYLEVRTCVKRKPVWRGKAFRSLRSTLVG